MPWAMRWLSIPAIQPAQAKLTRANNVFFLLHTVALERCESFQTCHLFYVQNLLLHVNLLPSPLQPYIHFWNVYNSCSYFIHGHPYIAFVCVHTKKGRAPSWRPCAQLYFATPTQLRHKLAMLLPAL